MCCKKKTKKSVLTISDIQTNHKVVLLGDSGVGKSSLLLRHQSNSFHDAPSSTIGGSFFKVEVNTGSIIRTLDVWDTAGQEKYESLMKLYYRKASAAIIVYDISSISSFNRCDYWINRIKEVVPVKKLLLVGTKCDSKREVDTEIAMEFAKKNCMEFVETSSKSGKNVDLLFKIAAELVFKDG